jgi:hypothetical protein
MKVAFVSIVVWLTIVMGVFIFADALSGIFLIKTPTPVQRGPILPVVIQEVEAKEEYEVIHSYTPPSVIKGLYLTSTSALNPDIVSWVVTKVDETELNAVVINVNDKINKDVLNDLKPVVTELNEAGVHTIARIATFQNEKLVIERPELALKWASGTVWYDGGGHHWIDPASEEAWVEIAKLSRQAIESGFREINYDYVRFPSDGAIAQAVYPVYDGGKKSDVINNFGDMMREKIKNDYPNIILSADIFAHAILVENDAGIGQNFIEVVDHFDVIAPMVYPSHYAPGNFGYQNPAAAPYGVAYGTMKKAKEKLITAGKEDAVVRPWFQDFDMGAYYGPNEVRAQFQANEDAGFNDGWFLWNARNVYTESAWETESHQLIPTN